MTDTGEDTGSGDGGTRAKRLLARLAAWLRKARGLVHDKVLSWTGWLNGVVDGLAGRLVALVLALIAACLFVLAIIAALLALLGAISGSQVAGLGVGAMIVALLGAPFLLWRTMLAHRTHIVQRDGHITDRITKAVEQLGTEKTLRRQNRDEGGTLVYEKNEDGSDNRARPHIVEITVPNIEVRLGGILSLERIAQDSTDHDKGRDHVRVMEILCAYIRENAPALKAKDHDFGEWAPLPDDATPETREEREEAREERFGVHMFGPEGKVRNWAQSLLPPREDIALALQVIGRRSAKQRTVEARWGPDAKPDDNWVFERPAPSIQSVSDYSPIPLDEIQTFHKNLNDWKAYIDSYRGYRPDLRNTNLQGADLSKTVFSGALLSDARLEGANLQQARLEGANLQQARLEGANLQQAALQGADLQHARLEGADLQRARLEGANLGEARLEGAKLHRAQLKGTDLHGARLEGANLTEAELERAVLYGARLEGANLQDARLEGVDLRGVWLKGAHLSRAKLEGAKFYGGQPGYLRTGYDAETVRMPVIDLSSTKGLTQDQIDSAFGDGTVILPEGLARPAHWPEWRMNIVRFERECGQWRADPDSYTPPPPPEETASSGTGRPAKDSTGGDAGP